MAEPQAPDLIPLLRLTGSTRRDELEALVRATVLARGIRDPRTILALRIVPRHEFVPADATSRAYDDCPLPIGWGQTISQPFVVALMTEAAKPQSPCRCLEIGTGSGYQTAILSLLCQEVYSLERIGELCSLAQRNLRAAGCLTDRVHLRHGDGYSGWPEAAPFDLIVVTAAPTQVPKTLLHQLGHHGRLIIPVGPTNAVQRLERWTRQTDGMGSGAFTVERLLDVRFVPMVSSVCGTPHAG